MSPVTAHCPSCRASIRFSVDSSIVTVCEYCQTAVARSDRGLEDFGKSADLVDSKSPLNLEIRGAFEGAGYRIVGRTQIEHSRGGIWDEWYCAFDDGRWGWLAEAQGFFVMTFEVGAANLPGYGECQVGGEFVAPDSARYVIQEKGSATYVAGTGEMPHAFTPGATYEYADCAGEAKRFATLDYSDPKSPKLFVGTQCTLDELGIGATATREENPFAEPTTSALALKCPNCQGSLDLVAPDKAKRVVCPYCYANCDVSHGALSVLEILNKENWPQPVVPLGTVLTLPFEEGGLTLCGFMIRSVGRKEQGTYFQWSEYLLYSPSLGFRWLTQSDWHWSYVKPVSPGEVKEAHGLAVRGSSRHRLFDTGEATVRWVVGEFYWSVAQGEQAYVADYILPPVTLSLERTANEINWSECTYLERHVLEKALGISLSSEPSSAPAPNQLYPYRKFYRSIGLVALMAIAAAFYLSATIRPTAVFSQTIEVQPSENPKVVFSEPFDLKENQNIRLLAQAPVSNSWAYFSGELIDTQDAEIQSWSLPVEYYFGNSGGESWSEGGQSNSAYLAAPSAGPHALRISVETSNPAVPMNVFIELSQGHVRWIYFLIVLGALAIIPFCVAVGHRSFEASRWSQSSNPPVWIGDEEEY